MLLCYAQVIEMRIPQIAPPVNLKSKKRHD
jgi:hypothetical protein